MAQPVYIWQRSGWPKLHVESEVLAPLASQARKEQGKVIGLVRAIGLPASDIVIRDIWVDETLATAAIEGESLDLNVVRSSVMRRLGMPDESSATVSRHVDGLLDVMQDAITGFNSTLDADRLCRWQSALFPGGTSGLHRITVGAYRATTKPMQIVSGPIGREKVHYEAPPANTLKKEMRQFLKWFEQGKPKPGLNPTMDGVVRAAMAHLWFETVHPFEDGNGRVGRAIVDMALAQDAASPQRLYSMSAALLHERKAYYDQLGDAQRGHLDVTPWVAWFIDRFRAACVTSQQVIEVAIDRNRYWATHAHASINPRQRKVLMRMLDAGPEGFEGGMSAQKYCNLTGASKATATRDLVDLARAGMLVTTGQGRGTRYWVNGSR